MIDLISVLMSNAVDLVADVIEVPQGETWVCLRSHRRAAEHSWLGCWSSANGTPEKAAVSGFLHSLDDFLVGGVREAKGGLVLAEHFFKPGWNAWGPGTPQPLKQLAVDLFQSEGPLVSLREFG
ncbi:hypothetical protein [Streptomyces sp. WAC 04229]|uniref:hypothetical protein n=1 Tax=Streptomyces sp. WAC 04229 TaxID=2203206 RepID=UPI003D75B92E